MIDRKSAVCLGHWTGTESQHGPVDGHLTGFDPRY